VHLAHYFRYFWEEPGLLVVTGEAEEIYRGYAAYNERYGIADADPGAAMLLKRLFAGAGLAAVSLSPRESWGWSLAVPGSTVGLFCGVEPEGMVCGRVLESDSSQQEAAVQRQDGRSPCTQSHFTLTGSDPAGAVERYFEEAQQILARVAVDDNGKGVLVCPLPGGRFDVIGGLENHELISRCFHMAAAGEMNRLEEVLLFYECRCNDEVMLSMITGLPRQQRKELWKDTDVISVVCPRCGRSYTVRQQ